MKSLKQRIAMLESENDQLVYPLLTICMFFLDAYNVETANQDA